MNEETQEFHGASVTEAVAKAAAVFNLHTDELEFRVVDEGSAGFLGIGARDARILVRDLERPSGAEASEEEADASERPEEPEGLEEVTSSAYDGMEDDPPTTGDEEAAAPVADAPEELLLRVDRFLTSLVDAMGLDATVDVFDSGPSIVAEVATPQTGLFIGQKGETIDAVQYLVNVSAYRETPFLKRIVVDSEGYRQRRVEALQGMAYRVARRAIREGRSISLPPMSAAERRVVHVFLAENSRVSTSSEGAEEERHVVVSPA